MLNLFYIYRDWTLAGHKILKYEIPWVPDAGINISFIVDGLSVFWAFLIIIMSFLVILYSNWYLSKKEDLSRYYSLLIAFMGSMIGVVFSNHLISLFVFWELTSITSFFLIGFWFQKPESNYGATKAILITGSGGILMLGGFLLLANSTGEWEISNLISSANSLHVGSFATLLIILGAVTKSAQWPFHIWLPNAMEAPTPISAFLHSATMVKAGIFLLSRFYPILSGEFLWVYLVPSLGIMTMISGGLLSLRSNDLKGILAYGTISQLGMLTTFIGLGGIESITGSTLHLYNHAAAKAGMFMVIGIIDHECGTRDVRKLSNLKESMPICHILLLVCALSLMGTPPTGGFITKEMLYTVSLKFGTNNFSSFGLPLLILVGGIITVLYHLRLVGEVFWKKKNVKPPKNPHDPSFGFLIAPIILTFFVLIFGIFPGLFENETFHLAIMSTMGKGITNHIHFKLWHGFNLELLMSTIALSLGILCYVKFDKINFFQNLLSKKIHIFGPDRIYNAFINHVEKGTWKYLLLIQSGNLKKYLRWMWIAPILTIFYVCLNLNWNKIIISSHTIEINFSLALCLLISISALGTGLIRKRIPAILTLGITGYAISGLFLILKAPDLALTMIMIETASVALFLLVFYHMPDSSPEKNTTSKKMRDWGISISIGATVCIGMFLSMTSKEFSTISTYFLETSKPLAGFKNVVNAIIVDYRGYDTLGEITVLVIAGIAISAIIQIMRKFNCDH
tara:strand:- start:381 stop:2597 length:2217 start_codon:yes stop_codon:yes gene_type:complete